MAFKFQGVDFLQFDYLLSDDELLVRRNTRAFVDDKLIPIIEQCNRDGRFPRELVRPMGELGFYGATIRRVRLRWNEQRRIRPADAGT